MNRVFASILPLLLFLPLRGMADRVLPQRCLPVDIEKSGWVLRPSEDEGEKGVRYRLYGDTLLTEVFREVRQWYSLTPDSCFYLGEESRRMKLIPASPIPTSAFGKRNLGSVREERDSGEYCRTCPLGSTGTYESTLPKEGKLTLPGGEKVTARTITETREETDAEGTIIRKTRTRWFSGDDIVPIAFQEEKKAIHEGSIVHSSVSTFTIDDETIAELISTEKPIEELLEGFTAMIEGDNLTISGSLPSGIAMEIALADIRGIGIFATEIEWKEDEEEIQIPMPPLLPGRYMLTARIGDSSRKILLTRD